MVNLRKGKQINFTIKINKPTPEQFEESIEAKKRVIEYLIKIAIENMKQEAPIR